MKQERLKKSYEWISSFIKRMEKIEKAMRENESFSLRAALQIYRPLRYAVAKAIEKPPRVDGNRAFCPDCGGSIRAKDNYCRICGQRLAARQQEEKPFYAVFDKKHHYGR